MADEEGHAGRAEHRHQNDERAPGAGRRVDVGVVQERPLAQEEEVVEQSDQAAKHHRAQGPDDADHHGPGVKPQGAQGYPVGLLFLGQWVFRVLVSGHRVFPLEVVFSRPGRGSVPGAPRGRRRCPSGGVPGRCGRGRPARSSRSRFLPRHGGSRRRVALLQPVLDGNLHVCALELTQSLLERGPIALRRRRHGAAEADHGQLRDMQHNEPAAVISGQRTGQVKGVLGKRRKISGMKDRCETKHGRHPACPGDSPEKPHETLVQTPCRNLVVGHSLGGVQLGWILFI